MVMMGAVVYDQCREKPQQKKKRHFHADLLQTNTYRGFINLHADLEFKLNDTES